jgi:hypothetical protein
MTRLSSPRQFFLSQALTAATGDSCNGSVHNRKEGVPTISSGAVRLRLRDRGKLAVAAADSAPRLPCSRGCHGIRQLARQKLSTDRLRHWHRIDTLRSFHFLFVSHSVI